MVIQRRMLVHADGVPSVPTNVMCVCNAAPVPRYICSDSSALRKRGHPEKKKCYLIRTYVTFPASMKSILMAWVGKNDLAAASGDQQAGPIAGAVDARRYDRVVLLNDWPPEKGKAYAAWLKTRTGAELELRQVKLTSPTNYTEIYRAANVAVADVLEREGSRTELTFQLSSGTPPMTAIWIILAKTRFPATLIQSSLKAGVETADVPFEIAAEFIPDLVRSRETELERIATGGQPLAAGFKNIVCRSRAMKDLLERARVVAAFSMPVLMEGESGTGKELLARAIHHAGPRAGKPFIAVNCGAIPPDLFESEFFGHTKGSFTGAIADRKGHFLTADGGTLFLDEVGELQSDHQARLLRVLQEKKVVRVGESKESPVDVRVIAATNRELLTEVVNGRFREDLFYRLAILPLHLPAIRDREGDLGIPHRPLLGRSEPNGWRRNPR